jgi:hypothetical protein
MADKEALARRLEPLGKEAADMTRAGETTVERIPTPFFARGEVYRVTWRGPQRPVTFTAGLANGDYAVMLAQNPAGFIELAARAGVSLGSDRDRVAYARAFLEATRDFRARFQILESVRDIQLVAQPRDAEKAKYEQLVNQYRAVIHPPKPSIPGSSEILLFALIGQNLFQLKLKVANDGKVERSDSVVEENLPISIAK